MFQDNKPVRGCLALLCGTVLALSSAWAKMPAPSDEAKAKAAEAAAKTAWAGKVEGFKLCKTMDAVAAGYFAQAKKSGKEVKPAVATPACADPGPFVYVPAAPSAGMTAQGNTPPNTATTPPNPAQGGATAKK